jgi:hypothetical protein
MLLTDIPGEYDCREGELIQIRFFCSPNRNNVQIRHLISNQNRPIIKTNSFQFLMGDSQVTVVFQYAFLLTGSCLNQVLVVENSPTGDDRITAQAIGGATDTIGFIFKPNS